MANNKKVFSIEINGITESVRSIDALTEKIKNLQKLINSIGNINIPIEIGGDIEKIIKQVNQVKTKIAKSTSNKQQVKDEQELVKALEQRKKALQAVNKELGTTGKNSEEFKSETKALVAEEEMTRLAQAKAVEIVNGAQVKSKEMRNAAQDFVDDLMRKTDEELTQTLAEVRKTRASLRQQKPVSSSIEEK